jgi:ABC-2 type transport system permease protein
MNAFVALVKKELHAIMREMTILIAIVIQLFIASFPSALLISLLSVYDPETISANTQANLHVGVVTNDFNVPLVSYLQDNHLTVNLFVNLTDANRAFENRVVDVILRVPDDTRETMDLQMILPRSETFASFVLLILREPLKRYENFLRQTRGVTVNYTDIPGLPDTTFQFLYAVIIPMLMLFPAFVAGSLVIDSTSEELETHTLETLYSAPLSLNTIFAAKIFAAFVVAIAQCALWLALLRLNRIDIQNIGLVLALAALIAAINITLSAFAATSLRDRERSQFVYSLFIVLSASASYFFDAAPIQTLTRLATGDYYTGIADVAKYAVGLIVLLVVFFRATKKMAVA